MDATPHLGGHVDERRVAPARAQPQHGAVDVAALPQHPRVAQARHPGRQTPRAESQLPRRGGAAPVTGDQEDGIHWAGSPRL